jgi:hypothetical protein
MTGQEIEGDLWDRSLGLDLPGSAASVRAEAASVQGGVRRRPLLPTSVQNLGSHDVPRLTKLALDQASRSCKLTHVSKRLFYARHD